MADPFIQQLFLSPWSGAPARGQLPQVPQRPALPTAVAELAGCLVRIPGGSGVADATYECQKQAAGTYAWVQIDGGSASGLLGVANEGAAQSGITTKTNVTGLSISTPAFSNARLFRFTIQAHLQNASTTNILTLAIDQDGTQMTSFSFAPTAAGVASDITEIIIIQVTAAAHTYQVTVAATGGGSASISGSQFSIEDLGAA